MESELAKSVSLPAGVPESSYCAGYGLLDVEKERKRQDAKWGISRNLHPQLWLPVLLEEVGEVAQALLKGDRKNYRTELVQVAATALAMIQDWDWQQENYDLLDPPQIVAFAWDRAENGEEPGDGN